jgi:tRNA nucleotidyltransferase (CCA-adding enzyme)
MKSSSNGNGDNLAILERLAGVVNAEGGKIYEVGGPVRDQLLNILQPKDLDFIICGIPFSNIKKILQKFGNINLVGQTFGVIKFKPFESEYAYDVSLPRKERSTGESHRDFDIDFDPDLPVEEDLGRRDFTINAMAKEFPGGNLVDPYGGKSDLDKRILKMVSDSSFVDDPLRMIRGVQFMARFNLSVEKKTFEAMKEHANLIKTVSPERIAEELNKLLEKAEKPSAGFLLMRDASLLEHVLPELARTVGVEQPGGYHKWDIFEHTLYTVDNSPSELVIRLAALLHDIGKPQTIEIIDEGATFYGHDKLGQKMAEEILKRLRYSNEIIKQVTTLVGKHMFSEKAGEKGIRRLINKVGVDLIFDLIALRKADTIAQGMGQDTAGIDEFRLKVEHEIAKSQAFTIKDLALNGNELKQHFGLDEGPLIGQILQRLLEKVLDDPQMNDKEKLLSLSADFLEKRHLDI